MRKNGDHIFFSFQKHCDDVYNIEIHLSSEVKVSWCVYDVHVCTGTCGGQRLPSVIFLSESLSTVSTFFFFETGSLDLELTHLGFDWLANEALPMGYLKSTEPRIVPSREKQATLSTSPSWLHQASKSQAKQPCLNRIPRSQPRAVVPLRLHLGHECANPGATRLTKLHPGQPRPQRHRLKPGRLNHINLLDWPSPAYHHTLGHKQSIMAQNALGSMHAWNFLQPILRQGRRETQPSQSKGPPGTPNLSAL